MHFIYTFLHLDYSESLTKYTDQKLSAVARFLLKGSHGNVHISKNQHEFCVEIAINTREKFFKASASDSDAYAAVDSMILKLEKQLLKVKKSFKNHKRPDLSREGRLKRLNGQFEPSVRFKKAA